jgi:hypothetical protein
MGTPFFITLRFDRVAQWLCYGSYTTQLSQRREKRDSILHETQHLNLINESSESSTYLNQNNIIKNNEGLYYHFDCLLRGYRLRSPTPPWRRYETLKEKQQGTNKAKDR